MHNNQQPLKVQHIQYIFLFLFLLLNVPDLAEQAYFHL